MGTTGPTSEDDAISAPKHNEPVRRSQVDALIAECKPGASIRRIEREAGLAEGALGHQLKRGQRGRIPSLAIMERFASALETDLERVSSAFAADSHIPIGVELPPEEEALVALFRQLTPAGRRLLVRQAAVIVECERDEQRAHRVGRTPS
ncbi:MULTISPECIES: hypothetical protein [Actinosynnema]|uniref:hypothetical protein n=1 Tax=Actinosynnema TaxID=40566 RepID=UPI0020A58870|nr:hypothetical protein [Actinosynnema pretiosum]MCP2092686.1 hypothetical protein [Actinosynnema pretiosum]